MSVTEKRLQSNEARKDRTRGALLTSAGRVFTARGYHATLISDIVAEAGVGQGTFYRFFDSKRRIFETLMEEFFDQSLEQFADMSEHLPTSEAEYREASLRGYRRLAEIAEANRDLILLFVREAPTIDAAMADKIRGGINELAALARFYLDHAVENGFGRPCDTAIVSQAIIGIGLRMIDLWGSGHLSDRPLPAVIEEMVDFAFLGIGKPT
jgi:AcrR family transcriptional regulator